MLDSECLSSTCILYTVYSDCYCPDHDRDEEGDPGAADTEAAGGREATQSRDNWDLSTQTQTDKS